MRPSDSVTGAVYAEQVDTIFRQLPIALVVNLANAAFTAIVLAPYATRPLTLSWFTAVALVTAGRLVLWLRYRRTSMSSQRVQRWSRLAIGGSLSAGLAWGIGGAILFPIVPVLGKILLTTVIGGMCAGAVAVSTTHLPALLAFVLSATLPMAVRFLADGAPADIALAAMTVVFAGAVGLAGKQLSQTFAETMRLRFELNEANQRLLIEIAEHQAAEAALRQAQKLEVIGQLTSGVAHDFNNLMTVVVGNLELAIAQNNQTAGGARYLRAAWHAAGRSASLIQRLLAFARKQNLEPRPLDLGALIFGMEQLLHQTLRPEVHLVISVDPDLAPAYVDANQAELAILNLVRNARDALPQGGMVRIAARNSRDGRELPPELPPANYVVISVRDDGIGMDEETRGRAFEPFFTTKPLGSGTGLGLSMVHGFAVQSGGAVTIRSEFGVGTTVDLWLPQAEEPTDDAQVELSGMQVYRGNANVLLCDDDDEIRRLLGEFLASVGYTVHAADAGAAAMRILNEKEIDLLIVDYAMPGMNGLETIRQARLRRPNLRSLLITGYASIPSDAMSGIALLRKPFAPSDLARQAAEILGTASR